MTNLWHLGPLCGFDFETTGVDMESDRAVSVAISRIIPGGESIDYYQLINPGIPIPEGATKIHGITDEKAQAEGAEPAKVIADTVYQLAESMARGVPIVGMNLSYDLTLLDREARRHGVMPLGQAMRDLVDPRQHKTDGSGMPYITPVLDLYVIDKHVDQFRPGSRKLVDTCRAYRVRHDGAHDALEDVKASCRALWRIGMLSHAADTDLFNWYGDRGNKKFEIIRRLRQLAGLDLTHLHRAQQQWKLDQATSLQKHLRESGKDPNAVVSIYWPLIPWHDRDAEHRIPHQNRKFADGV